jgi:hypothetical protein
MAIGREPTLPADWLFANGHLAPRFQPQLFGYGRGFALSAVDWKLISPVLLEGWHEQRLLRFMEPIPF